MPDEKPTEMSDLDWLMSLYKDKVAWLLECATVNGECLECHLSVDKDGYAQVGVNYKNIKAHRLVYKVLVCDPGDLFVLHKCDNPRCINPKHLFHGTQKDNIDDMTRKGRRSPNARSSRALSDDNVRSIREEYPIGWTQRELGEKYGVNQATISHALRGTKGYDNVK